MQTHQTEFLKKLNATYRTEIFGVAYYRTLATLTRVPRQKLLWRTLEALELQTRDQIALQLKAEKLPVPNGLGSIFLGVTFGLFTSMLSWRMALKTLRKGAEPILRSLEQQQQCAPEEYRLLMIALVAHEQAQLEFVKRELAGRESDSYQPLLDLLEPER